MADTNDLGRTLREALRRGPSTIAAALNVGADGQSTSVYVDQDVTIVQHNGETEVIRHDGPSDT